MKLWIGKRLAATTLVILFASLSGQASATGESFEAWLAGVKTEAASKGVSKEILDAAFKDVKPIPRVIELDRKQPEFTLTFEQYLSRVVNDRRVKKGRKLLQQHKAILDTVSKKYGVQPRFIVALWGIETDYGRITGGFPVIASLATLAFDGRRSAFFRKELMLALQILEQGHIKVPDMKGSWAGAMGQSQFMPSSFHAFATDHDGDGAKDIWGNLDDVFASIANYLGSSGWRDDLTWGREVQLPSGFSKAHLGTKVRKPLGTWQDLGVRRADGTDLPTRDIKSSIVVPKKNALSPAFLAYHNYNVILKWNRSTYFALAVGHLSDRLAAK